jgi:hypothetical protein
MKAKAYNIKKTSPWQRIFTTMVILVALALIALSGPLADEAHAAQSMMPPGVKGDYETAQSQVLEVFAADENGARFRAYLVRWKDFEVIVSDPLGTTDKRPGDMITFMAQRLEMPHGARKIMMLQFMIMDFGAFQK